MPVSTRIPPLLAHETQPCITKACRFHDGDKHPKHRAAATAQPELQRPRAVTRRPLESPPKSEAQRRSAEQHPRSREDAKPFSRTSRPSQKSTKYPSHVHRGNSAEGTIIKAEAAIFMRCMDSHPRSTKFVSAAAINSICTPGRRTPSQTTKGLQSISDERGGCHSRPCSDEDMFAPQGAPAPNSAENLFRRVTTLQTMRWTTMLPPPFTPATKKLVLFT